jgi:hypothetical protein
MTKPFWNTISFAISLLEIGMAAAEVEVFEAKLLLARGETQEAAMFAHAAMLTAARALLRTELGEAPSDADAIAMEFRTRFVDRDRVNRHAMFLYRAPGASDLDEAKRRVEEALLFIEAAHQAELRLDGR